MIPNPLCPNVGDCLTVANAFDGTTNNNIAVVVGANDLPANVGDLVNIFDGANDVPTEDAGAGVDDAYDASPANGNDTLLILSED